MKIWWSKLALRGFKEGRQEEVFCWVTRYLGTAFTEAWSPPRNLSPIMDLENERVDSNW